jgi:hypothetical protein
MVFFILFLWNMLCGVWANQAGDPVVAQQNRQKMHVVIKMFFVMGVSWIAEIILFFVNWLVGDHKIYKGIFLFQLINSLQVNIYYMNWLLFHDVFSQLEPMYLRKALTFLKSLISQLRLPQSFDQEHFSVSSTNKNFQTIYEQEI